MSLATLFRSSQDYVQLNGDLPAQDVAVLRLILAILLTVYSRYQADGQVYDWVELDPKTMRPTKFDTQQLTQTAPDELLATWQQLWQAGHFSPVVTSYLEHYQDQFDLYSSQHPFGQVTLDQYNQLVPTNKRLDFTKSRVPGRVDIKQINRLLSESNNKINVFANRDYQHKNDYTNASLARWLITYQNYTGKTDKTKIFPKGGSLGKGWLYNLNPVYAVGQNLFETLMLNLTLIPQDVPVDIHSLNQQPIWEQDMYDYVKYRLQKKVPTNLAELYTMPSRMLYFNQAKQALYAAGYPAIDPSDAFVEPMTTWKLSKNKHELIPAVRYLNSINRAMWRNFGQYVALNNTDSHRPGIVTWLKFLSQFQYLNAGIHLRTAGFINDGQPASQMPAAAFSDDLRIQADILFDGDLSNQAKWPAKIEAMIDQTNQVGTYVWHFGKSVANLRQLADPNDLARRLESEYYQALNNPFKVWLASLRKTDNAKERLQEWQDQVYRIARQVVTNQMATATPLDQQGRINDQGELENIFTFYRRFQRQAYKKLKKEDLFTDEWYLQ